MKVYFYFIEYNKIYNKTIQENGIMAKHVDMEFISI